VLEVLRGNPVFDVLAADVVSRRSLDLDRDTPLALPDGSDSGLRVMAFAVPGKVPLYLEADDAPAIEEGARTIGLRVADAGGHLFFVPGCAAVSPTLAARLRGAPLVLFDGTLWTDDEMIRAGLGSKTGLRMGHMSVSGPNGTMAAFATLGVRRKILIHINNSNPILLADTPERATAAAHGWEVAYDGMEITL
jgi:pyrroloquinoline quinone biosynthesis protein B